MSAVLVAGMAFGAGARVVADDGDGEAARRVASGRKAASAGDVAGARHHLLGALAISPASPEAFGELLRLDEADAEARRLWVLQAVLAGADAQGKFAVPKAWGKVANDDLHPALEIARLRSAAAAAIASAASKLSGSAGVVPLRHLEDLAHAVEDGASALASAREAAFTAARAKVGPDRKAVVGALLKLAQSSVSRDPQTALVAARIVRGLSAQEPAGKAAPGAPNDAARAALDVIERVREAMRKEEAPAAVGGDEPSPEPPAAGAEAPTPSRKVWTLEELVAIPETDVQAWNRAHAEWTNPGVGVSPTGLYRVETTCGLGTLAAVLEHVETQHARLVRWNGSDPFGGRQGLVRVCPTDGDFEAEGRPFWWAGGFQSGDVTTMVARFPHADDIAGTLVHELCHRFDVRAWTALPPWAMEGRAVYVSSCSMLMRSEDLDERFTNWGKLWEAHNKGYWQRKQFEDLLKGSCPDYRHNYDAGYALWLFLTRFRGFGADQSGKPLYAPRIAGWLESHAKDARAEPVKRFVAAFADGRDGRAADLDAFVAQFGRFCGEGGSGARPPAKWKEPWEAQEYRAWEDLFRGGWSMTPLYDAPTWVPGRDRHDPPETGEELARRAAELLLAAKQRAGIEAMRWALAVDEPDAAAFARGAEIEADGGDPASAWAARAIAHRLRPGVHVLPEAAPPSSLAAACRSASALAGAYAKQAEAALAAGRRRLAAALRAEHDRIAEATPLATLGELPAAESAAATRAAPRVPELIPERSLLEGGTARLVEERWAPLDSEPGMPWRLAAPDQIELGRAEAAADVSGALRDAITRKVAVRTKTWHAGTYSIRTRVRFVSAFADAVLVVGRTGRDRGVQLRLAGGDWEYATGVKQGVLELQGVHYQIGDLRTWTDRVAAPAGEATFRSPREVFDVEIRVSGPYVQLFIDGAPRASFRRAGGAPVEGGVVFGLERGIVRFEEPVVRRHRVLGPERVSPEERFDEPLRFDRAGTFAWETAPGRRVEGLPADPRGTLVLWFPEGGDEIDDDRGRIQALTEHVRSLVLFAWAKLPRTVVALAPSAAPDGVGGLAEAFACDDVVVHAGHADAARIVAAAEKAAGETPEAPVWNQPYPPRPLWIAVDAEGVIRSCGPRGAPSAAVHLFRSLAGR